jgi:hypothetical protein
MVFDPFSDDDDDDGGVLGDVDPDQNFLNEVRGTIIKGCNYYYSTKLYLELKDNLEDIDFSVCHLNIRSLPKNIDTFKSTLFASGMSFNVLAFTETWLNHTNVDSHGIVGFNHEYLIRDSKSGGGTSIFINQDWSYKVRNDLTFNDNDMELLWLEIDKDSLRNKTNMVLGVIYRRPGSDPRIFNEKLHETLLIIYREKKTCLHTGDYNLNLLNSSTHLPTNEFIDLNFEQCLFPTINKPTRISPTSATLIDNVFSCPAEISNSKSGILLWDISDHFPVFYIHLNEKPIKENIYRTGRSHNFNNNQAFTKLLAEIDWTRVTEINDTQAAYTIFHDIISKAYDSAFPLTKTKIGYDNRLPWLTHGLKRSIKRKHYLHSIYLKRKTSINKKIYLDFKNKLAHILKIAERSSYQEALSASKDNMRKSWMIIKEIINKNKKKSQKMPKISINGHLSEDPQLIANSFNNFFTNIGNTLDKKILRNNTNPISFIPKNYTVNLFLNPATETEVSKIIDNLKNCAVGWDLFPSSIFKDNKSPLSKVLLHIVNLSLEQGIFPKELKLANVIPIFKSGETEQVGNYRPVSLLSTVSKVFERIFYTRLLAFLKEQNILYLLQFGFREGHSTQQAIIKLLESVIESLDSGNYSAAIFLDFSKAFDTVNHNILLKKLDHYGIRGIGNKWVDSYLSDRTQFSTFGGCRSDITSITCGVPQGSILGPLLFLLYINDLGSIFRNINTILFADDSNLIANGTSLLDLERKINSDIPLLINWLRTNRLSLNLKKTHIMVFGRGTKARDQHIEINIDGTTLDVVTETKFLGIMVDNGLTWKSHANYLHKKLSKSIGILSRARKFLNLPTLKQLYFSFLFPYLSYGNIIWGRAAEITLDPIFKIQKRAIRIIMNIKRRDSTKLVFKELNLLRLPEIYTFSALLFMYQFKNHLLPIPFDSFYTENRAFHHYPTRLASNLRVPLTRTKMAATFIKKTGVSLWNSLSDNISHATKIGTFKKDLIKLLTSNYSNV